MRRRDQARHCDLAATRRRIWFPIYTASPQGHDISIIIDITITKEETLTRIIHRTCFVTSVALLLLFSIAAGASAQKKDKKTKRVDEAIVQSKRAAETFDRVMKSVDQTAFQKVFDQAKVVGVVQFDDQGGTFLTALIGGKGLFCLRDAAGWRTPVFFYIGGGSLGLQFGTKSTSIILLFMNDNAASWLSEKSVVLQGEKKIIPGPTTEAPDPAVNIYG